jgi:hypothetical protein
MLQTNGMVLFQRLRREKRAQLRWRCKGEPIPLPVEEACVALELKALESFGK